MGNVVLPAKRLTSIFLFLLCACAHQPGHDLTTTPGDGSFSASGNVVVLGARFPARWHFDEEKRRSWFDISLGSGREGWMLLDWAAGRGYNGGDGGCFEFALRTPMPDAAQLRAGRTAPPAGQLLPDGLAIVRGEGTMPDILVVQEPEAVVLFEISGFVGPAGVPPRRDTTSCRPMAEVRDALLTAHTTEAPAAGEAILTRNERYTFTGAWHMLRYAGAREQQTASQYTTAVEACKNAGSDKCKPYWETGGWLGRYGYHCGDGWGSGHAVVSPQDYCCKLHDAEAWGRGNREAGLCGLAACITCKYYSSLAEWRDKFTGDHYATVVIAGQVGVTLTWIGCWPLSSWTGFTCDGMAAREENPR